MAKVIRVVDGVSCIPANKVYPRKGKNYGRHAALVDNEQRRCEHAVMMLDGWDKNQVVEITELDAAALEEVRKDIEAEMVALEKLTVESKYPTTPETKLIAAQRREGFKAMWYPEGKLELPTHENIYGFQRIGCLADVMALKIASGAKQSEVAEGYLIPVRVVKYATEAERIKACGLENTRKDTGRVSIMKHWPSLFQLAYDYFVAKPSATMAEINELLAGGKVKNNNDGIKVHSLLLLDHRFPEIGIKDKILNAGFDADGKDLGQEWASTLDRTRVWKLAQWLDETKANKDIAAGVDFAKLTTAEVVNDYLANPNADKDEKIVMASKALVNTQMNSTPNGIEKFILYAIANNKMDMLTRLRVPGITIETLKSINEFAVKLGLIDDKGQVIK